MYSKDRHGLHLHQHLMLKLKQIPSIVQFEAKSLWRSTNTLFISAIWFNNPVIFSSFSFIIIFSRSTLSFRHLRRHSSLHNHHNSITAAKSVTPRKDRNTFPVFVSFLQPKYPTILARKISSPIPNHSRIPRPQDDGTTLPASGGGKRSDFECGFCCCCCGC